MIVIAYFHYDTLRSAIEKFTDKDSVKKWLYDRWGHLLEGETVSTLEELISLLINKYSVIIETLEI